MKTSKLLPTLCIALAAAAGCSKSVKPEVSETGPAIINAHTEPGTVELGRDLKPASETFVVADVKDYKANVDSVTLKFKEAPIEVPMEHVGGTTWRAQLTPQQLQLLAISGKSVTYKADIEARNSQGQIGTSTEPLNITVKTPDLSQPA